MNDDTKDFLWLIVKFIIGTILVYPLFMCAAKLDNQAEMRAKELGCADGQSAYLSPLSNQNIYKSCKE